MKKATPLRYETAVTFVRVNIPHHGHIELVEKMLAHGDEAYVYVSTGKANNDWDLRVLLLSHLCREAGIDLGRVNFVKAGNPFQAVEGALNESPWEESVLVFGEDQSVMAEKLSDVYDCPFILNRRSNSSTQMRFFLDKEEFIQDLKGLYRDDEFATSLAMVLRKEEVHREKSLHTQK
jgi:nicotinamide mononucleotide adenylyltransferase